MLNNDLISILRKLGLDPTAEESADLIWLAARWNAPANVPFADKLPNDKSQPNQSSDSTTNKDTSSSAGQTASPTTALYPVQTSGGDGGSARQIRSPAAFALPGALEIGRKLRPLKRRVPSRTHQLLDETATVHYIADTGEWRPILRPVPERWLDVVLVVDESASMVIWQRMITELVQLLERQGAFRSVHIWGFRATNGDAELLLYSGYALSAHRDQRRNPAELIDPLGRRLLLIVSDCVAPLWHNGVMAETLAQWGQKGIVTLVQMLPDRLWARTGLRTFYSLFVRSPAAGTINAGLQIRWESNRPRPSRDIIEHTHLSREQVINWQPPGSIPIPVVTLEELSLGYWSRSLAGASRVWIPGVLAVPEITSFTLPSQNNFDAEELVNAFHGSASPTARRLATYLSIAPLTLPIMRLVQRVMLPESRQVHLAEIFLSGLLQRPLSDDSIGTDSLSIEFISDGVRKQLQSNLRFDEFAKIGQAISEYIDDNAGQPLDFAALIRDPNSQGEFKLSKEYESFAHITAAALRGYGGQFSEIAARLEANLDAKAQEVIQLTAIETVSKMRLDAPFALLQDLPEDVPSPHPDQYRVLGITSYVVAVTSQDQTSQRFGTAFVVHRTPTNTYLLTCNHVINDVGIEGLLVGHQPASVVAMDEHFDLALLSCEGKLDTPTLALKPLIDYQSSLRSAGYISIGKHGLAIQTYELVMQNRVELESKQRQSRSHGWRLQANTEIASGSSGAPVLDGQGFVVGIICHKLGNEQGFAIAVETLSKIWPAGILLPLPEDVLTPRSDQQSELNITNKVVTVTNKNPTSQRFGTAFVIHRTQTTTYLLTCKHVLDDVGAEGLQVGYQPASVVAVDEHFDLALLRCEEKLAAPTLRMKRLTDSQASLRGAGYSSLGKHGLAIQTYELVMQNRVELESKQRQSRSHGWRLQASAELVAGCSGAPVLDAQGFVVGVISHKLSNEQAFAVSIETLLKIWPDAPPDLLHSVAQSAPLDRAYRPRDAQFLMNCEKELDLFTQIAAGEETGIRLINVYGEGGMGKSHLLREFQAIANDHALHCLHFSLGVTATVEEQLDTVVAHYDALHFPDYEQLRFNRPESPTREKEQNWLSNLTRAFLRNLTNYVNSNGNNQRLVLFFDQYEKSNEIFRWWLEHTFLVLLPARLLLVIVAGREPIERKPAWKGYHAFHLNGVGEEWYHMYAQHQGVVMETQQIKFAHSLLKGRPKDWVEFVGAQMLQSQSAGGLI